MAIFILNDQTANSPVQVLLSQAAGEGVEVLDPQGNVLAYVLSPEVHEALVYAEAELELTKNRERLQEARQRRGGITTEELLRRAKAAEEAHSAS